MLRLASDPDDTYVPYAMTNKELTDSKDSWTESVTQASGKAVFDNLNPNYDYKLFFDDEGATGDITVPSITGVNKVAGTTTGTIKLSYTVNGGTDGTSKYKLRILK